MKIQDVRRKVICALDTGDVAIALDTVKRLSPYAAAFKIGHALTLAHGLDIIKRLQDAGAERIFLDLKFHDIPNVVGLAVREAARYGVWMTTLHISGGAAMIAAAVEEAKAYPPERAPLLMGVSVLTSLSEHDLHSHLGISRSLVDHMGALSQLGTECGLDGVVCSVHEAAGLRAKLGSDTILVTPGIRPAQGDVHDQERVADAREAMDAGADYVVVGRALTAAPDPELMLAKLGFTLG